MYTLRSKDQVYEAYEDFKAMVERQTGFMFKILRSDKPCPYSPEQIGVAEGMDRTEQFWRKLGAC